MNLLKGDVRAIYRKYFLAAFGSALISCIYGVVDMAMVGQYQGPDGTAALVTAGVLAGGIFIVFGDYFCVFTLDMGMFGAGLATAVGAGISFVVMLSHFFTRRNTLRLRRPAHPMRQLREIGVTGFSTFLSMWRWAS